MFYGRTKELDELNKKYRANRKQFGVIYGRRHIGKTETVKEFLKGKEALYFPAGETADGRYLGDFLDRVNTVSGSVCKLGSFTWEAALDAADACFSGRRYCLVIDDYPCLVASFRSFPSVLQAFYDHAKDNLFLIIIGDNKNFMRGEIKDRKAPLYWRQTFEMELDKMPLSEALMFLEGCPAADRLDYLSLMSSYPYYLSSIDRTKSFENNITKLVFSQNGLFSYLSDDIMMGVDGERNLYDDIFMSLAKGYTALDRISRRIDVKPEKVKEYLEILVNAGIIKKMSSFREKTYSYVMDDSLLRFWYLYVFPDAGHDRGDGEALFERKKGEVYKYLARSNEDVAVLYLDELNANGELVGIFPHVRKYIAHTTNLGRSVKMNGVAKAGDTYLVFDCLTAEKKYDNGRLIHLKENASVLPDGRYYQYYIFSRSGFDCDMELTPEVHCFTPDDILQEAG